jgi:hypothetical protein
MIRVKKKESCRQGHGSLPGDTPLRCSGAHTLRMRSPGHERSTSDCIGAEDDAGTSASRTSFRSSRASRVYSCAHGDTGLGKKYGAWYGSVRPRSTRNPVSEARFFSTLRLRFLHWRTGAIPTIFRTVRRRGEGCQSQTILYFSLAEDDAP